MAYTPDKPRLVPSSDELRTRIPGWGADLDPADRPSVPRERYDPDLNGAHWQFPEQQPGAEGRERSIEHAFVTPVFGTSAPLKGFSGVLRRWAYRSYSEGRAAHWLILIAADRVDAVEAHVASVAKGRPDDPVTETGLRGELTGHGVRSRFGRGRADLPHQPLDPLLVGGPWVVAGAAAVLGARALARRR